MSDIVERLNNAPLREVCEHGSQRAKCPICELAEAEAEIERLRAALLKIANLEYGCVDDACEAPIIAVAALEGKDD